MTDDTSKPPAPQPGWVATVTLELVDDRDGSFWAVKWPDGTINTIAQSRLAACHWSPPPPPPWEPEIGKDADWRGDLVIVRGIFEGRAWLEDFEGDLVTVSLSDLSPPKGGEA